MIKLKLYRPYYLSNYQKKWALDLINNNNPLTYFTSKQEALKFINNLNSGNDVIRKYKITEVI